MNLEQKHKIIRTTLEALHMRQYQYVKTWKNFDTRPIFKEFGTWVNVQPAGDKKVVVSVIMITPP